MTDKSDVAALRPSERAKLGFVTDDDTGGYYVAECDECGKIFPSQTCDGGEQIADTGDYGDCYCPLCGHVDPQECDNANLVWNIQQMKIINLTSQLEAERQRCAEITEQYVDRTTALSFSTQRAETAEKEREGLQKALVIYGDEILELRSKLANPMVLPDVIRDANRYRFLRDEDAWGEDSDSWDVETRTGLISSENLMGGLGSDHFDAAIDARMAASEIPFFNPVTAQQKPVISKEKLCDWLEDNFDIDDSQRAAFAACFSHCCDCIVQSDLPEPVGEIVAWAGTDRDKGITREIDFRFLRFDVMPGTKLYAVKPASAILSDVLAVIREGRGRTELIGALTVIKSKFGAPGSRDVDVLAAHVAIDKAIEKLSNL